MVQVSAEQGYAQAQYNLGVMYENGQGVTQDFKEALQWYRLSAAQGDAYAQNNLGVMYANGRGVTQDYIIALKWWSISASNGFEQAREGIVQVKKEMTPAQIAEAKKRAKEWMEMHKQ